MFRDFRVNRNLYSFLISGCISQSLCQPKKYVIVSYLFPLAVTLAVSSISSAICLLSIYMLGATQRVGLSLVAPPKVGSSNRPFNPLRGVNCSLVIQSLYQFSVAIFKHTQTLKTIVLCLLLFLNTIFFYKFVLKKT